MSEQLLTILLIVMAVTVVIQFVLFVFRNKPPEKSNSAALTMLEENFKKQENRIDSMQKENERLTHKVADFEASKERQKLDYDDRVARINDLHKALESDRQKIMEEKIHSEKLRLEDLKRTWSDHEKSIEVKIKQICQKHDILYVGKEKFPYKGKPDNCIKICNQYIIFDSKSPSGDDLNNFSTYVRTQAEAVGKYVKFNDVRKEIYLVVPTNAVQVLEDKFLNLGAYRVLIITEDALEPILIALRRIEDYEFAENLDPEEKEKVIATLGKMVHHIKRRIQIDNFFVNTFIAVLNEAEYLPPDIRDGAKKVEQASKLNPPLDQRAKVIDMNELRKESEETTARAAGQNIEVQTDCTAIDKMPLSKGE